MAAENSGDLVSVIVPVYKAELYLRRCVDSLLRQTYRNLEVILVDDGSPDRSPQICDEYAKKDTRVKVIHRKNGGVSRARNAGLAAMSPDGFLTFLDADDWLPRDAVARLAARMTETGADFVGGGYRIVRAFFFSDARRNRAAGVFDLTTRPAPDFLPPSLMICSKLFRKETLRARRLAFRPDYGIGEDVDFVLRFLQGCGKAAGVSEIVYCWSLLPAVSGSRRRCAEVGRLHAENQRLRLSFFDPDRLPPGEQRFLARYFLCDTLRVYAELPRAEAVDRMAEAQTLFADMTRRVDPALLRREPDRSLRRFGTYRDLLAAGDYDAVYDRLRADRRAARRTPRGIAKRLLALFRPLSRFLVYRLQLFYRD